MSNTTSTPEALPPAIASLPASVETASSQNPFIVLIASYPSAESRRSIDQRLRKVVELVGDGGTVENFPWHLLTHAHTAAIRARLLETPLKVATVNAVLAALRRVLKECWRLGLMGVEDYHRAVDLPAVRGSTLTRGRSLERGELRALFEACARDPGPSGRRDAALIAIAYGCGLRRSELCGVALEHYNEETGELKVVAGKGRKDRLVYAPRGTREAVSNWLDVRGREPGPLLCRTTKGRAGGILLDSGLTSSALYQVVSRRCRQAGISDVSPHDLRRSFVSDLLDAGADLAATQRLCGHSSPSTTSRYDRRPEEAKRQAAELLQVPV